MSKQKGLAPIIIVLIISAAISGYLVYSGKINLNQTTTQVSQPSPTPSTSQLDQDQVGNTSPNGAYRARENLIGDYNTITLKDKQGNIIVEDLVKNNEKEIGYNVKFRCQCGTSFKDWISDDKFTIEIVNGGGEEYEYTVDAKTGKVDEPSFKRIK